MAEGILIKPADFFAVFRALIRAPRDEKARRIESKKGGSIVWIELDPIQLL